MQEQKQQQRSHAERVARRAFIKRAALSAVGAVPAMETLTRSDLLVRSALAATGPADVTGTWHISFGNGSPAPSDFHLQQSGSSLTGDLLAEPLTGSLSGNHITFSAAFGAFMRTLAGTVTGNTMSGTWSLDTVPALSGTWTASKV